MLRINEAIKLKYLKTYETVQCRRLNQYKALFNKTSFILNDDDHVQITLLNGLKLSTLERFTLTT